MVFRYSRLFRGAESKAVESLPDFSSQGRQRQVATGTDGKPAELQKSAYKKLTKKPTLIVKRCPQLALVKSKTR